MARYRDDDERLGLVPRGEKYHQTLMDRIHEAKGRYREELIQEYKAAHDALDAAPEEVRQFVLDQYGKSRRRRR